MYPVSKRDSLYAEPLQFDIPEANGCCVSEGHVDERRSLVLRSADGQLVLIPIEGRRGLMELVKNWK